MNAKALSSKDATAILAGRRAPRMPAATGRSWTPCRRRGAQPAAIVAPPGADVSAAAPVGPTLEVDARGVERVAWREEGWNYWDWEGRRVHYITAGDKGSPVVLIHGFGASAYHYRYNIPELAKKHRVFALDLLGFGLSEKLVTDYSGARLWTDEVAAFLDRFVGEPAVLVGNSLGGYVSFATAARHPELVRGVVGINAAGFFEDPDAEQAARPSGWVEEAREYLVDAFRKGALVFAFYRAKQPGRIRQVLETVYLSKANLDEDLVRSIALPAQDPRAPEVFTRVVNTTAFRERVSLDSLFAQMDAPLLLLWGDKDPWMTPEKAEKMLRLYPRGIKIGVDAGHCPHDEAPEAVNEALIGWLGKIDRL